MSENSNSANGNSWTVLSSEVKKTEVENVGPVAEATKTEGSPACSSAPKPLKDAHTDLLKNSTEESKQCEPANSHESKHAEETHPSEPHQVKGPETGEGRAQLNAAEVNEEPNSASSTVEDLSSWTPDHEEQDALTGQSEGPVTPSTDADSFFDSYTHISSTSGPNPLPVSGHQDGLKSEEETDLKKTITEDFKPDVELLERKEKEGDGLRKRKISHLRSLDQGKTESEDDEEGEEEFQVPQRDGETVFSLNKCILAAVILLGLGTIFFSGVLMDTDDEGDVGVKDPADKWLNPELSRDAPLGAEHLEVSGKRAKNDEQILKLQAQLQQRQGELKAAQCLAKEGERERVRREELEKDYQKIKEELDRLPAFQKELEQENERIKEESDRAKKDLEALPSLHRELEHLRAQVSQLTQSTDSGRAEHVHLVGASGMPSSGHIRDVPPIETQDMKRVKHWDKGSAEKGPRKGEKEWKKKTSGKKDDGKQKRERVTEEEHAKEQKDRKRDKSSPEEGKTGESKEWKDEKERKRDKKRKDGKTGKENQEKKVFKEWDEKKDKNWKKDRHEGQDENRKGKKDWKDTGKKKVKEDKEKEWKQRRERKDWKEEKEWKNDKQSGENDQKEWKGKKKEWKEKDEWKGEKEWRRGKSERKFNERTEKKWKGEKKYPEEFAEKETEEKHWRGKEREWPTDGEWKRDEFKEEGKSKVHYHKNEGRKSHNEKEKRHKDENEWSKEKRHKDENEWSKEKRYKDEKEWSNNVKHRQGPSDHMSTHHHNDQRHYDGQDYENYWPRQREKIQHNHRQRKICSSVADCARVEGLSPVSFQDFEILLQSYLNKIQYPEDQTFNKEELRKLVKEFFTDGVFVHDQMPFSEFVEDVADILEDMADGEESDVEESEEDDDDDEEEMEEFEREAMEMFALPEEIEKVEKKQDKKKESGKMKG